MACPTCDHTVTPMGGGYFICPRCGTAMWNVTKQTPSGPTTDVEVMVPKLVGRCREFEKVLDRDHDPKAVAEWHRLGVEESINTPANRPGF